MPLGEDRAFERAEPGRSRLGDRSGHRSTQAIALRSAGPQSVSRPSEGGRRAMATKPRRFVPEAKAAAPVGLAFAQAGVNRAVSLGRVAQIPTPILLLTPASIERY